MFERFTERARQVVVLAQDEARALRHNYIGTEHLLLGLLREEEGLASRVLTAFDVTVEEVRAQVARIVGEGDEATTGQIPFTPRAKKLLELGLREALVLGHNYIGTEHLLLALARTNEGVGMQILWDMGVGADNLRDGVMSALDAAPVDVGERRGTPPGRITVRSIHSRASLGDTRDWVPTLVAGIFLAVGLGVGLVLGWAIWS